jgi:RNA polymerase sigma-70 factor, ECF subfamily
MRQKSVLPLAIAPPVATSAAELPITFTELYQDNFAYVYRYALARTGSVPDAQDITSQTFLAAFRQFNRFQGRSRAATWLFGIAHHKLVDYLRQQGRSISLEDIETEPPMPASVEAEVQQTLDFERVIAALAALSPDRREALSLHLFGERSLQETAAIMGRSYEAVQMLITRGIQDLRLRLKEEK